MGVKELWDIVSPVGSIISLSELQNNKVAVDLSCWICDSQNLFMNGVNKPYLRNLFFRTWLLLENEILPVYVIEGEAPSLKFDTIASRNKKHFKHVSSSYSGKRSHFQGMLKQCKILFNLLGIPWIQAEGEADATCALLDSLKVVSGVITQDSDVFLYGASCVYRNFTSGKGRPTAERYLLQNWKKMDKENKQSSISKQKRRMEDIIREKSLSTPGFPFVEVISEFTHVPHISEFYQSWRRPILSELIIWCIRQLGWEPPYALEKTSLFFCRWYVSVGYKALPVGSRLELKAKNVHKKRIYKGMHCFDVEWELNHELLNIEELSKISVLCTVEPHNLVEKCFPYLLNDFFRKNCEKDKQKNRPKKGKTLTVQKNLITNYISNVNNDQDTLMTVKDASLIEVLESDIEENNDDTSLIVEKFLNCRLQDNLSKGDSKNIDAKETCSDLNFECHENGKLSQNNDCFPERKSKLVQEVISLPFANTKKITSKEDEDKCILNTSCIPCFSLLESSELELSTSNIEKDEPFREASSPMTNYIKSLDSELPLLERLKRKNYL